MFARVHFLVLAMSFAISGQTQTPAPTITYTLHTQWPAKAPTLRWTVAPDNSLLFLLPQGDGQWAIKRVTAWETTAPKEETLTFSGVLPHREKNPFTDLSVDPVGAYLIVRLRVLGTHDASEQSDAIIAVVDLRTFKMVFTTATSDSHLARGSLEFNKHGVLLSMDYTANV